jgi:hypothetical protein
MSDPDPHNPEPDPEPGDAHAFGGYASLREALGGETRCLEFCPICRAADVLRASATPEMREQWHGVQREALMTLRAAIDHYLDRLDSDDEDPGPRVQDIPID